MFTVWNDWQAFIEKLREKSPAHDSGFPPRRNGSTRAARVQPANSVLATIRLG